ncbi:hypothetical protein RRG08_012955 [Elysia crispata]|uniref:Uncharacterized protein n=1 Tax=Elysia crispata TaxID=231223 RepID=A0AAE1DQ82_9GAST|nr:hypothetical protein RRG08_012955 [Elysia crispata]
MKCAGDTQIYTIGYVVIPGDTQIYTIVYVVIPGDTQIYTIVYVVIPGDTQIYTIVYVVIPGDTQIYTIVYVVIPGDTQISMYVVSSRDTQISMYVVSSGDTQITMYVNLDCPIPIVFNVPVLAPSPVTFLSVSSRHHYVREFSDYRRIHCACPSPKPKSWGRRDSRTWCIDQTLYSEPLSETQSDIKLGPPRPVKFSNLFVASQMFTFTYTLHIPDGQRRVIPT